LTLQQGADDLNGFAQCCHGQRSLQPELAKACTAGTKSQCRSSAAHLVQRCNRAGCQCRMPRIRVGYARTKPQIARRSGDRCQAEVTVTREANVSVPKPLVSERLAKSAELDKLPRRVVGIKQYTQTKIHRAARSLAAILTLLRLGELGYATDHPVLLGDIIK